MTAGAAAPPPPARARLAQEGARLLVEVLSSPDALGRVEVRLPDGARRLVHTERLDPLDDAALELLTRVDRVVRRAAAPRPAAAAPAPPTGRPIKLGTVREILGAAYREPTHATGALPDSYLLTHDQVAILCLVQGAVVSRIELERTQRRRARRIVAGMDKPPNPPGSAKRPPPPARPTAADYRRALRSRPAVEWK